MPETSSLKLLLLGLFFCPCQRSRSCRMLLTMSCWGPRNSHISLSRRTLKTSIVRSNPQPSNTTKGCKPERFSLRRKEGGFSLRRPFPRKARYGNVIRKTLRLKFWRVFFTSFAAFLSKKCSSHGFSCSLARNALHAQATHCRAGKMPQIWRAFHKRFVQVKVIRLFQVRRKLFQIQASASWG